MHPASLRFSSLIILDMKCGVGDDVRTFKMKGAMTPGANRAVHNERLGSVTRCSYFLEVNDRAPTRVEVSCPQDIFSEVIAEPESRFPPCAEEFAPAKRQSVYEDFPLPLGAFPAPLFLEPLDYWRLQRLIETFLSVLSKNF